MPAIFLVLILSAVFFSLDISEADASEEHMLVDYGDGKTVWYGIIGGGTLAETLALTLENAGASFEMSGTAIVSINGEGTAAVGTQSCSWLFYLWDDGWRTGVAEGLNAYGGETFAVGYYPDGKIVPTATPRFPAPVTQCRYDSSYSGISASQGPPTDSPVTEWSSSFQTGFVNSSILYSGGNVYFTTGGKYGALGSEKDPAVYCLDAVSGEILWKRSYPVGAGYEVSSPLIVGNILVVAATNGHIYGLDVVSGEPLAEIRPKGEEPHFVQEAEASEYETATVYDADGNWILEGQRFITGATTPVYDSGALYFNTFDGSIHAYSVGQAGFSQLWKYVPSDGARGCFYYHPPVIAETGGKKVVLAGSYSGRMYCVDACTGEEIWVKRLIDFRPSIAMPGSVGPIIPCSGDRAIAVCGDGDMATKAGKVMMINLSSGDVVWSFDSVSNPPTVVGNLFCAYLSPSALGSRTLKDTRDADVEAEPGYYGISLDTGRVEWKRATWASSKTGFAYSDGRLYSVDYSPGTLWPSGGGVTAIDPNNGNVLWRIRPEPYDGLGYSITQPTVADGRIFFGNDSGIVYCISDGRKLLLVDYGDRVEWFPVYGGPTLVSTAVLTLKEGGADVAYDWNSVAAVNGTAVTEGWRFFSWKDGGWESGTGQQEYLGGHIALAAYREGAPRKDPTKDYGVSEEADETVSGFVHWSWFTLIGSTILFMAVATALYRR